MKKLLFTLIGIALFLTGIGQDTKPTAATFKQVQSPQFWFNSADTSVWMYKGSVHNWTELQGTSKKYSIWNHKSIVNTGWSDGKVLGFNVSGNLVPLSTIIPATTATAIATSAKTATISGYTLKTGDFIALTLTAGNSAAAMTLAINGGAAKNIRMNAVNTTTVFSTLAAGSVILLYYDGTYLQMMGSQRTTDTDTDNFDRIYWNNAITAGSAIYDYKIIMQGTDGKFYPLTLETGTGTTKTVLTTELRINSPILYYNTTTDVALNGSLSNVYSEFPLANMTYTFNVAAWTNQLPIYLKGTVLSNGNFKLDNTSVTSFATQTLPTTADGFVYILLGQMYSTTAMRLFQYHPIYEYKDGAIRQYIPTHTHNYEPPLGNPPTNGYVLASTTAGVRSWVANGTGGGIALTDLSAGGNGLSYDNTTGQFYISSGYSVPTTVQKNNFVTAYSWGDHAGLYAPLSHVGSTGAEHGYATALVAGFMTASDFTKLAGIETGATNYSFNIQANSGATGAIANGNTINFANGTDITVARSGNNLTFSYTGSGGSMVYPGAGIPISTGSAWGTSIPNNMGKVTFSSGYSGYFTLSPGAFSTSGSDVIVSAASSVTGGNYLPVQSDAVHTALLAKQDNLSLTTTGTSGAATLVGSTLNIPQYAGGTNYWSTDAYGIYRSSPVAINGTNTVGYDQTVHGRANFLYTGGATAYAISSESNGTLANFYALNTGANGAGIFCNATGTGSFGGILQGQRSDLKVSMDDTAPASATATGQVGEIRVTAGYIYVCTATNTWVRAALSTW